MKSRLTFIIVGLVALALALVLFTVEACRDCAFIDQNTGARKGYREWFFGARTGSWYRESALETFMRTRHPGEFRQQWVSYAGTGRNVFGRRILAAHGRPGPIVSFPSEMIDDYCRQASETEKRRLYDVFSLGDSGKIQELLDSIGETVLNAGSHKTEQDGPANASQPTRSETDRTSPATGPRR